MAKTMAECIEKSQADAWDVVEYYKEAYLINQTGCIDYINGECDDCGVCEREVPEDIENWI